MPRGRPPKSTQQHEREGTYRPGRHDTRADIKTAGTPKKPANMHPDEEWMWGQVRHAFLAEIDTAQLRQLCKLWRFLQASEKAAEADPLDKNARTAVIQYGGLFDRLAAKFGLNPADRSRIKGKTDGKATGDERFFGVVG